MGMQGVLWHPLELRVLFLQEGRVASAKGPREPFGCGVELGGWGGSTCEQLAGCLGVLSGEAGVLPVG